MQFRKMRNISKLWILFACVLISLLAGCQGQPAVVYIVLSPTPTIDESLLTAEVTELVTEEVTQAPTLTGTVAPSAQATATNGVQITEEINMTTTPQLAPAASPTPLPPGFPTPVIARIQVVEQLFERGRMFWLQPNQEVWVLTVTGEGRGTWQVFQDTFTEGEAESDTSLTPPSDGLIQPIRGFGKIWREVPGLRDALGWAVTPEFGYLSDYQYNAGGSIDGQGQYIPGSGYHVLYSLYGEQFRFNEADGTWQLGGA